MRLENLIKPMSDMTDEELTERLKQIRHNREVVRPAAKARHHREQAKGKVSSKKVTQLETLLASMTPEERSKLIASIQDPDQQQLPLGDES